ncbi:MAG: LURP-one-related/scramblase family protein [Galactobacter sp.]
MTQQPHGAPVPGSLLQHDLLVMQQITNFNSNDMTILDGQEAPIGHVVTKGSGAARFLLGSRELDLLDWDGTPLAHISDTITFGRDRFEITYPDGTPLAQVLKRMAMFTTKVEINVADGSQLQLKGDMFGYDFRFVLGEWEVAYVSRQWAGMSRGLLGHSRYAVSMRSDAPDPVRRAIISCCVVLDLIRQKRSRG